VEYSIHQLQVIEIMSRRHRFAVPNKSHRRALLSNIVLAKYGIDKEGVSTRTPS
jgi:hypothetical protein